MLYVFIIDSIESLLFSWALFSTELTTWPDAFELAFRLCYETPSSLLDRARDTCDKDCYSASMSIYLCFYLDSRCEPWHGCGLMVLRFVGWCALDLGLISIECCWVW
jgi:hypothetical protein